ncbi:MAG: hypothetical protein AAF433_19360 [Bacteroidota bacterium]
MQTLKELAKLIPATRLSFPKNGKQGQRMEQLFSTLKENEQLDDDDAAELIFGSGKDRRYPSYKKLKHQLKYELVAALLKVEPGINHEDGRRAFVQNRCRQLCTSAAICLYSGATDAALSLFEQALTIAEENQFTILAAEAAHELVRIYANKRFDKKRLKLYLEKAAHYENERHALLNLERDMCQAFGHYIGNDPPGKIVELGFRAMKNHQKMVESTTSARFITDYYLLQIRSAFAIKDYPAAARHSRAAIHRLKSINDSRSTAAITTFYTTALSALIQLKEFEEGNKILGDLQKIIPTGSQNHFKMLENAMLLSLRSEHYQEAYDWFRQYKLKQARKVLPAIQQEAFAIYRGYLFLLASMEYIHIDEADSRFSNFRVARFMNQTERYSKEKQRHNVNILIIQMLYFIISRKYNLAIDRIEPLQKYCSRHLRKSSDTYRSNCFIRMLLEVPINAFHRAAVERKGTKWLAKLKEMPSDIVSQPLELEIIPYEKLWQMVLDSLELKRVGKYK